MADTGVITVPQEEYEALIARNEETDDRSPDPLPRNNPPRQKTPWASIRFPL